MFSIQGFGTVFTGTLLDGILRTGDEILVSNKEKKGRIRGMQIHKVKVEIALPGTRLAVNVAGLDVSEVKRGDLVSRKGATGSTIVDAWVKIIDGVSRPIRHNDYGQNIPSGL